ncbi:TetR family transcriptional regulator [Clostridium sporogenes]|jgi:AcrR family transcriptional regulator|uniref:TetR family transcriptional regulator n=3 Tax=Clostridium TaxID=1485 RepID=A0AAE5C6I9_CLOSG|nr:MULTISPECIES: TetR/AcrR family transcriptional regulator [Clostridium]EKS4342321.1 TetR/AcrR family transcriptional regulator [Clostridium botulinum]MBE6076312.1 TetR/AcrR family transcriptional regulator [Clostridium lundense]EDU37266.1 transcriptional regulator, TetR family [Clostridium sporogenes ATCC 15579]EKS4393788.1 TetR/AcrR family transcriptional regulator [Clostridium botulinum]KIS23520.1 TetR family transcriptional regulator [Clostridium botulinum B2 450]
MDDNLKNIPEDKKEAILKAALEEFATRGYEKASTNKIVEKAGVSKGLLFHYFCNKKGLFIYVYNYYFKFLKEELYMKVDTEERDILERVKKWTMIKMNLIEKYPSIFMLFIKSILNMPKDIKSTLEKIQSKETKEAYENFLSNIDYSKFKENIDIQKCLKILMWTLEKYGEEYIVLNINKPLLQINKDNIRKEIEEYVDILKAGFYR